MKIVVVNNYKQPEQFERTAKKIEACTGHSTERIDYNEPNLSNRVSRTNPDLVILTGSSALLSQPKTREVFLPEIELVRDANFPILGICYGHQIIGSAFNSPMHDIGQMLRRYEKVKVLHKHPLFEGLPSELVVAESHRQELVIVPKDFQHLARSLSTHVEAIAHRSRPIFGVQFHPERSSEEHPHGRMILQNLMKML